MPIRCRTLRSFLEYWVFSATERLFPSKGALESDSRTGPDWIAPERRDYRNVAQVAFGLKIPHSDKRTYQDLASYYRGDLGFLASCWRMMRSALDVKNYSIPTGLRSR